jgi:D-3-phosphoglycerate dehydrogenase
MHAMPLGASVKAIGRAGAGTNNIPVAEMSKRGVPVFNAPGANANAVKELVLAALLLAARNVVPALHFVASLDAPATDLDRRSKTPRSNSPVSSSRGARSASSASAPSAAWSRTPPSSSG